MADKTYQRSLRMTEEVRQIVEKVKGEGFNQKFENLVLRCFREEKALDARIAQRRKECDTLSEEITKKRALLLEFNALLDARNKLSKEITQISLATIGFRERLEAAVTQTMPGDDPPAPESGLQEKKRGRRVTQKVGAIDRTVGKDGLQPSPVLEGQERCAV